MFAAPPGRQRWQLQFFAKQMARQRRQETQQGRGLQECRARRIGHQHIAGAYRLQQAGNAQMLNGLPGYRPVAGPGKVLVMTAALPWWRYTRPKAGAGSDAGRGRSKA